MTASDAFMTDPTRRCAPRDGVYNEAFTSDDRGDQQIAKAACRGCPVRGDCLLYALDTGEVHGVWGGVLMSSHHERWRAIREQGHVDRQVLELWGEGLNDRLIAAVLGIDKSTVRRARVRQQLPARWGTGSRGTRSEVAA